MADEKRQLILDLLARNKMKHDTNEAADDLDKLGRAAEDADKKTEGLGKTSEKTTEETDKLGHSSETAAAATEKLGDESRKAGEETDKLGNKAADTRAKIAQLNKEIALGQKELRELAGSYADAGSAAEKNDISKAMRRTETEIRKATKNQSLLKSILPEAPDPGWAKKFGQNINSQLSSLSGEGGLLAPALIAGGVAAAPALGAAIAGAVVGAVGVGGIVGGFALVAKDPRVTAYAKDLKTSIGAELKDAAQPFVPVAIQSIGKFKSAIQGINFKQIFSDAAKQAGPLVDGVTDLITKLGGAVTELIHNSGPEVKAIGAGISEIGGALADGLSSLADDGPAAADALKNVFTLIDGGIRSVFGLIDGLTKVYEIGRKIGGPGIPDAIRDLEAASTPVAGKLTDMATAAVAAAEGTDTLAKAQSADKRAAEGQRDALIDVSNELRKQTDPAFAVLDAMDQVTAAQNEATKATHKYGANSEQARSASRKLAEAALDLQGDVGALGGSFDGKLTPTMKRTLKAAGLTKAQIKEVEGELKRAKAAADAYAGKYVAEIITNYTYNTGGNDYNREANRGSFSKRAAGGPVVRGVPYLVGENGPEIMMPDSGGRVISAAGSRGLMVGAGIKGMTGGMVGGGGFSGPLELKVAPGGDQGVATLVNFLIRTGKIQISVAGR